MMANDDFAARLLQFVHARMPVALQPWSEAMLGELAAIEGFRSRLRWALGCAVAILRARWAMSGRSTGPLAVRIVAAYLFVFSAELLGVLTWQIPRIRESWWNAAPTLAICYGLSALPALLGLGLAVREEAARVGTVILSVAHAALNLAFLAGSHPPHPLLTALRIAADAAIIVTLNRRGVRPLFEQEPLLLRLRG